MSATLRPSIPILLTLIQIKSGSEICAYLNKVVDTMDLRKYIQFNTELLSATWDERGFWKLRVRRTEPGRKAIEEDLEAEIFVNNSGTQDKPLFPEIPGLEAFHGKVRLSRVQFRCQFHC